MIMPFSQEVCRRLPLADASLKRILNVIDKTSHHTGSATASRKR